MPVQVIPFPADDSAMIEAAARLLVEAFRDESPDAWPDLESAREEVHEALQPDHVCLAAIGKNGALTGWIAAIPEYDGHAWELHPLVVDPAQQRKGIGRALVTALEREVAARGAITLFLGTDDESGKTSLSRVDLYDDLAGHIARIKNLRAHPYEFYQKVGFIIVGVIPDASGPGKPDILMAKRLRGLSTHVTDGTVTANTKDTDFSS